MRQLLQIVLLLTAVAGPGSACYEDSSLEPQSSQGLTRIFLTDAPFPFGFLSTVEVYVVEISASTESDTLAGQGSWTLLAAPRRRFDLLRLGQSRLALVGELTLQTDLYRALRLTIDGDSSALRFKDGTEARVMWPNNGQITVFALVEAPMAVPDSGGSIVIDIDVGQSFAYGLGDPLHDFAFTPKTRAVSAAQTGSISGTILGDGDGDGVVEPVQYTTMNVSRGDRWGDPDTWSAVTTGVTDSTGYYKVGFLLPGSYIVQIAAPDSETLGSLIAHDVKIVAGEEFLFSVTLPVRSTARIFSWR